MGEVDGPGENTDDLPRESDGDGLTTNGDRTDPGGVLLAEDVPFVECAQRLRVGVRTDDHADLIAREHRRRGVRATLRDRHHLAVLGAHGEQEIGEGKVGEQLPLGDDALQVCRCAVGKCCVFGEEISQRRHR
ncbi:Uncharacterised protein [Mycobacteroides abscessus subsp. abscessus]|nr:Uncharacterised protein [Mycobacteroides abscessus subsp. abscessus]